MSDRLEITRALDAEGQKRCVKISNETIKCELLKTYFYFFMICTRLTYIQIIDIVKTYVYKKEIYSCCYIFYSIVYKNIESTILNHGIMRK